MELLGPEPPGQKGLTSVCLEGEAVQLLKDGESLPLFPSDVNQNQLPF